MEKTKAQIVQGLLDKKVISTEEAVKLLQNSEIIKEYIYVPCQVSPITVSPWESPYRVTCNGSNFTVSSFIN